MAININDAWKVNKNGTLRTTPSYNISNLNANFTNLDADKRHGIYNNVPLEMWWAHYDWGETTPQSTIDYCRSVVSRANEMFDYSYCWAGLGYESFISRTQYVCYYNLVNGKGDKPVIYQDESTNTPWTFDYNTHETRSNYFYPNGQNWNYSNFRNNKGQYGYQECWKNNTNTGNPNNSTQYWGSSTAYAFVNWTPLHIIAPKNWVNLIVVIAKKSLTSLDFVNNVGAWDLYTYAKTSVHEEYPYVIGTFIVPYMEYDGSAAPSGKRYPLQTGDSANAQYMFRLTNYVRPSIAGQYIYTSDDDVTNYFHESPWHSGIISRSPMQGSFVTWSGFYNGGLRYLCDTSPTSTPLTTLCAIQIGGAIRPMSASRLLNENGIYSYADTLYLSVELGNSKWQREFGEYTYTEYDTTYTKKGVCYYREFDSSFYEECMQQTACFGLLFTDRHSVAYEGDIDDRNMFLGVLDDNNIGHGEYTRGYENLDQKQLNWTNTEDADYSPSYNPPVPDTDPNTYNRNWAYNLPSGIASGVKYYIMRQGEVTKLIKELWAAINTQAGQDDPEKECKKTFLSTNPMDVLVSLKRFPFSLESPSPNQPVSIKLGTYTSNAVGYEPGVDHKKLNLGSAYIHPHFGGNFLDYSLTSAQLYVPFCGIIDIDISVFMGAYLSVDMVFDLLNGAVTAYVHKQRYSSGNLVEDKCFYTLTGQCSIDLPFSGIQTATIENQLMNTKTSSLKNAIKGFASGATIVAGLTAAAASGGLTIPIAGAIGSGVLGAADSMLNATKINYDMTHTEAPIKQMGSQDGVSGWYADLHAILYIYRPVVKDEYIQYESPNQVVFDPIAMLNYGKTVGFATLDSTTLSNYHGYTEIVNANLSTIPATATEKIMIQNALTSGVILPY